MSAEIKPELAIEQAKSSSGTIAAFSSQAAFEAAKAMASALSKSTLVPKEYQNNAPNCLIAMEIAARVGISVFAAMQNLDIIHGRPSWRSTLLIATVNASGRFSPLRYRFEGKLGTDDWGCRAVAKDRETGEECVGPLVTIKIAKDEGWYGKNGSKWKTLPELMLNYRSAAFWTRVYAPELSLGMHTVEEVEDIQVRQIPDALRPGDAPALEAVIMGQQDVAPTGDDEPEAETGREPGQEG